MDITEIIKLICVKRKISLKELASKSGQSGQNLYNKLLRNDWKLSELQSLLTALDSSIKIVFIDNLTGEPFTFQ